MAHRRADQRGLALIMVLWSMVLLGLVAAAVMHRSTEDLRLARNLADSARVELAADAAVRLAIAELVDGATDAATTGARRMRFDDAEVTLLIEDEYGRVDLNGASPALFAALIAGLGAGADEAAALADAIADFRDGDGARRPRGAEDADYAAAGLAFGAADAPFDSADELSRVLGMPTGLRSALLPYVTTYTGRAEPRRAAAAPPVLAALAALERRQQEAGAAPSGAAASPAPMLMLGHSNLPRERPLARISADAVGGSGARFVREAVVELDWTARPPYRVLAWRRLWLPEE